MASQPAIGGGEVADLGGTFIGPIQDHIVAIVKELAIGTFPKYNAGDNVFMRTDARRETFASDTPVFGNAPADPQVAADVVAVVAQLDNMAAELDVTKPWAHPHAPLWDAQTLESSIRQNSTANRGWRAVDRYQAVQALGKRVMLNAPVRRNDQGRFGVRAGPTSSTSRANAPWSRCRGVDRHAGRGARLHRRQRGAQVDAALPGRAQEGLPRSCRHSSTTTARSVRPPSTRRIGPPISGRGAARWA
jgi:hypothetical protein